MNTILIARHGNTFDSGDKVVRVGLNSDLPLSTSGKAQAVKLGEYLKSNKINIHGVFTSSLKRTIETATIALHTAGLFLSVRQNHIFDEIDYGPDEGKTEEEVIARIGKQSLLDWDQKAIVPNGWLVDPDHIVNNWRQFTDMLAHKCPDQTVLVVTSNGIARFAPYLTGDYESFCKNFNIKLAPGALGSISKKVAGWEVDFWNVRPE